MANSQAYNDFHREMDVIAGVERPRYRSNAGFIFKVCEAVRLQEYRDQIMLGADGLEAHCAAWRAFQGVMDIDCRDAPAMYQTTEAKTITGKGVSC